MSVVWRLLSYVSVHTGTGLSCPCKEKLLRPGIHSIFTNWERTHSTKERPSSPLRPRAESTWEEKTGNVATTYSLNKPFFYKYYFPLIKPSCRLFSSVSDKPCSLCWLCGEISMSRPVTQRAKRGMTSYETLLLGASPLMETAGFHVLVEGSHRCSSHWSPTLNRCPWDWQHSSGDALGQGTCWRRT